MTKSGSGNSEGVLRKRRARFNHWRRGRPFAGGVLLILASFVIAWIPIHIAGDTILLGKALSPVGLLFAALVFLCGMFALTRPGLADIFGIFGIVFSVFSLYGALGGFLVGTALGIIGGVLCYAWIDEDEEERTGGSGGDDAQKSPQSDFTFDHDASEDESNGLFGSRSVRSRSPLSNSAGVLSGSRGAGGRTASVSLLVVTVVVLSAFAYPFITAAAADSFPEQTRVDGTIVIAERFSATSYNHQNVTTDTSNRAGVSAARMSFGSANIQGMTIYKNFRTGSQGTFHLTITGNRASAPNGLSLTTSEAYFAKLGVGTDPVVIPAARKKWTTCPGQDFLLRTGDLGPAPDPPIEASGVVTNTHRMYAQSITITNLTLTMEEGTKSTNVQGTPECTTNPVEPVLDLFTANALELLTDNGVIPPSVTTNSTVSDLTAPEQVEQGETFDVNATVTNTGFVNDTKTVAFRFADERRQQTVTLVPDDSTTVTFADVPANVSEGTYNYTVSTGNDSETGTITVTEPANTTNKTTNGTVANTTTANTTTANATTTPTMNETTTPTAATETTANDTDGNETTTTANESTATAGEPPSTSAAEDTPTPIPTETRTTDSANDTETATATPTKTTPNTTATPNPSETSVSTDSDGDETGATTATETQTPTTETQTPTATESTATNSTSAESLVVRP